MFGTDCQVGPSSTCNPRDSLTIYLCHVADRHPQNHVMMYKFNHEQGLEIFNIYLVIVKGHIEA